MAIKAVLFDFSGTLFRLQFDASWLAHVTNTEGESLTAEELAELQRRMSSASRLANLDEEHTYAWENRDLDAELHRKSYLEVLRQAGFHHRDQALELYERVCDTTQWTPYPDTEQVLKELADSDISVAIVSNIGFEIRDAFRVNGLDRYVDEFVLSYEVGAIKPNPAIFQIALTKLGIPAYEALMIGDDVTTDGGAEELGCAFARVEPIATQDRPTALLSALQEHGVL